MIRDTIAGLRANGEGVKTVLIGGFLLASGALFPVVFVLGYVARVIRTASTGRSTIPVFGEWWALLCDGLRLFVLWLLYGLVPLVLLATLYLSALRTVADPTIPENVFIFLRILLNYLAALLGTVIGSLLAALMAVQMTAPALSTVGVADSVPRIALDGSLGGVVLVVLCIATLLGTAYLVPAAFANAARERAIRAGFDWTTLGPVLFSRRYATGWLAAMVGWVLGVSLQWLWLLWRLWPGQQQEPHAVLQVVGVLPVVVVPTPTGIANTAFTLLGAFVTFFFLVAGYAVIGRTLRDLTASDAAEVTVSSDRSPARDATADSRDTDSTDEMR